MPARTPCIARSRSPPAPDPLHQARSDRYRAGRADRPAPAVVGSQRIVSLDPYGPWSARRSPVVRRRLRHPPDHRGDQGAPAVPELKHALGWTARGRRAGGHARPGEATVHQGRDRAGVVPAGRRGALRRVRDRPAPHSVRADRRHVPRAGHPHRSRRCSCRRSAARPSTCSATSPTLGDPACKIAVRVHDECNGSDVFGSDICTCRPYLAHGIEECVRDRAGGRRRRHRLQPQGGPGAGRGDQVPGLQRAQAAAGRRQRRAVLRAHRVRRRRAGHALSGADARRAALAGHQAASIASSR